MLPCSPGCKLSCCTETPKYCGPTRLMLPSHHVMSGLWAVTRGRRASRLGTESPGGRQEPSSSVSGGSAVSSGATAAQLRLGDYRVPISCLWEEGRRGKGKHTSYTLLLVRV